MDAKESIIVPSFYPSSKNEKDYSTQGSQVVTNLTTNWALPVLTS